MKGRFRVECKTTGFDSYRLEESVLQKIINEAGACSEIGIMNIQYEKSGGRYVVMTEEDFEELVSSQD